MRKPIKIAETQKRNRPERIKLIYDYLKHLTTLSSGSVLVTLALTQNFFKDSPASGLLLAGVAFFLLAILSALLPMAILAMHVDRRPSDEATANTFSGGFIGAIFAFFAGMLFVAAPIAIG